MTKKQRYRYEMLVRAGKFGDSHKALFPEASTGAARFAEVAAAIAAVEDHLKNRVLGIAEGRKVKPLTRAAVHSYMKTIAKAARRVTRAEHVTNPFRMPQRRTLKVEVATARAFLQAAEARQEAFVRFGMPATFISDFTKLVDDLQTAANVQLTSKVVRGQAQAGIKVALRDGFNAVLDLDVIVAVATADQPTVWAAWQSARFIEGQRPEEPSAPATPATDQPVAGPVPAAEPTPAPAAAAADKAVA